MQPEDVDDSDEDEVQDITSLDDVLHYLGDFNVYQQMVSLMLLPFSFFSVFIYFAQIFITLVPEEHWCELPEVNGISKEDLRNLAIPRANQVPHEGHDMPYSRCWIYDVPVATIAKNGTKEAHESWPMKRCDRWQFNFTRKSIPYATIATELYWVCSKAYLVHMAQSIFFVGSILGGLIFGWMADKYGRIPVLVITNLVGCISGVATIFSTDFWQFSLCRFLVGVAYDNNFTMMYILVLEYVGPKWRTWVANISIAIFFPTGCCFMAWMAYYIRDWKVFSIVTSMPLAFALFTPCVTPESIRWLVSQGRIDEAIEIMKKIQRVNEKIVPDRIYAEFKEDSEITRKMFSEESYNIRDLFRTPRLRRFTILLIFIWSCIALVFDGHIRNLGAFNMNIFRTFTIASATTFPADILVALTLDHWGRRWLAFGSMFLSGMACFAASLSTGVYFACLGLFGRFLINISYSIGLQYAAELLPTVVRAEGVSVIHIMGYAATIISPFIAYVKILAYTLPILILGTLSIFAGILCLFLPETLDEELPQTLQEGECFGTFQKFYDMPCLKREEMKPVRNRHHLHAKRPTIRGELLRSSIISGVAGNKHRLSMWEQQVEMDEEEVLRRKISRQSRITLLRAEPSHVSADRAQRNGNSGPGPKHPGSGSESKSGNTKQGAEASKMEPGPSEGKSGSKAQRQSRTGKK